MDRYEHKQVAYWLYWFAIGFIIFFMMLSAAFGSPYVASGLSLFVAAIIFAFSRLNTSVDANGVSWAFGWGWPAGHIALPEIASVEITTTNLFEGWGIHWTIWHGWLWNVSGFRAVELTKRDGSRVTLGTDDPEGLYDAVVAYRNAL
jgi:hypothetical protein